MIKGLDSRRFEVSECHDPTAARLAEVLEERRPHLVHFMGHGKFDVDQAQASIALCRPRGGTDWVDDRRLAEIVRRACPRVMVLHACEGAKADFNASFAGARHPRADP